MMVRFESKELTNNSLNLEGVMPSSLTYKLKAIVDLPNPFRKCVTSIHLSFLSISRRHQLDLIQPGCHKTGQESDTEFRRLKQPHERSYAVYPKNFRER